MGFQVDRDMKPPGRGQTAEGLGHCGVNEVEIFLTLDQLRLYGPLALREWLKRNMPNRPMRGEAQVLEFGTEPHQEALSRGGGS